MPELCAVWQSERGFGAGLLGLGASTRPVTRPRRTGWPSGRWRCWPGGSRWGVEGAEAVLRLRAVIDNGDFAAYWAFHVRREDDRVHQARHQDEYVLTA